MREGYNDTLIKIAIESIKDEFLNLKDKVSRLDDKKAKDISTLEDIQKDIQQIQNIMKIEDVYNGTTTTIIKQVDGLIKSISDLVDHKTLETDKESIIIAAKQFQGTIKRINNNRLQLKIPLPQ